MIVHVYEHEDGAADVRSPADDRVLVSFTIGVSDQSPLDRALEWVLDNGHELAGVQAELFAEA